MTPTNNTSPRLVLITGASSGIGRATAEYFHRKGWQVVATMRTPNPDEWTALQGISLLPLDVTDAKSRTNAVRDTLRQFGKIDALVNNAGYALTGPLEAMTDVQIQRQIDTNVVGLMATTREVVPSMRARGQGTIINISSVGGRVTFPLYSAYHASKWAVEGFSESLQFELAPFDIKVRIIEPGPIRTDFYTRSMDIVSKEGLTAYDAYQKRIFDSMTRLEQNAPGPEVVAKTIFDAVNSNSGRLRYPVGGGAPALMALRSAFGERMFRRVIRTIFKG